MQSQITSSLIPDIFFFPTHVSKFATSLFLLYFTNFPENTLILIKFLPILYPGTKILEGLEVYWYQTPLSCIVLTWRLRSSILISVLLWSAISKKGMVESEKVQKRLMTEGMEWLSKEQNKARKLLVWKIKIKNYKTITFRKKR